MNTRKDELLDGVALFAAYLAFAAFSTATSGVAAALGIGWHVQAITVAALLCAPLSLHRRTFGIALALLTAMVMAVVLLYSLALGRLTSAGAARAPAFWPHL